MLCDIYGYCSKNVGELVLLELQSDRSSTNIFSPPNHWGIKSLGWEWSSATAPLEFLACLLAGRVCHELDSVQIALDMNPVHWFCDRIIRAPSLRAAIFGNVKTLLAASEPIPSTSPLTIRLSLIQVYLIKTVVCGKRHLAIKLDLECKPVTSYWQSTRSSRIYRDWIIISEWWTLISDKNPTVISRLGNSSPSYPGGDVLGGCRIATGHWPGPTEWILSFASQFSWIIFPSSITFFWINIFGYKLVQKMNPRRKVLICKDFF